MGFCTGRTVVYCRHDRPEPQLRAYAPGGIPQVSSRTRKIALSGLALVGTVAVLAGCSAAPSSTASAKKTDFRPCMVSDSGGFDDKSFNELGYDGLQDAAKAIGATAKTAESKDSTVYDSNIEQLINQNCKLIVTVGFNLADATKKQAAANPDTEFAIIDDNSIKAKNVKPDRKSTRLNSSHSGESRMPSSA